MLTLTPAQRRIAARVKENVYKAVVRRAMIYALTGSKAEGAKSEQDGQD